MTTQINMLRSPYFTLEQLTDGVYAAMIKDGTGAWSNAGIVDLGDKTLVFDTFATPQAAQNLRSVAELVTGNPIAYVVNSHWHGDHVWGNQVFYDTAILSTAKTRELMAEKLELNDVTESQAAYKSHIEGLQAQRDQSTNALLAREIGYEIEEKTCVMEALPSVHLTLPTVTFDEKMVIHGTRRSVELLSFGGGHTQSDAILYLPDEKLAFMGDLVTVETHPFFGTGQPREWLSILNRVREELSIDVFVPGHGTVGTREHVDQVSLYLQQMLDLVRPLVESGVSLEQVMATPIPEPFANWRVPHVFGWNLNALFTEMSQARS